MISDKNSFLSLYTLRNICCGYLLESPQRGDSNKYPWHMFLGILNTILFNFSNYPFHLVLKILSIQIVIILSVGIKRDDCIKSAAALTYYAQDMKKKEERRRKNFIHKSSRLLSPWGYIIINIVIYIYDGRDSVISYTHTHTKKKQTKKKKKKKKTTNILTITHNQASEKVF